MLIVITILLACLGLYILVSYLSRVKCPGCKKRHCSEASRKETSRQQIMFEEEEVIKHVENKHGLYGGAAKAHAELTSQFGKPDSTTIRKYKVPGERIHYKVTYKCNDCGHVFTGNTYVDNKAPVVK